MKLVTAGEMRGLEDECVRRGTTVETLMSRAGEAIAARVRSAVEAGGVLILAGPGNNGGDGLVAAAELERLGIDVTTYTFRREGNEERHGRTIRADDDRDLVRLRNVLASSTVVVDALLGIGQTRPIEGELRAIVDLVNDARSRAALAVSVDIPTGVDTDTGRVLGTAFRADVTVCMGVAKVGTLIPPGRDYAGTVEVAGIGMPLDLIEAIRSTWIEQDDVTKLLPVRPVDSNKGSSGRLLVVGGSSNFTGALVLVSLAAYRIGAGLVEIAAPESIQGAIAGQVVEAIHQPLTEVGGHLSESTLPGLHESLAKAKALVIGPGLGLTDSTIRFVSGMMAQLRDAGSPPAVVDADALNALARLPKWNMGSANLVLTPHPGEMSRLTGVSIEDIQRNRLAVARKYAAEWGQIVVLKGAATIVAGPDGYAAVNSTGSANLATAGTGDVLSGTIGGLLAQRCSPWAAALCGVYLHGLAGDMLRGELGDAGTLAGDLPGMLPLARQSTLLQKEME